MKEEEDEEVNHVGNISEKTFQEEKTKHRCDWQAPGSTQSPVWMEKRHEKLRGGDMYQFIY